MAPRPATGEHPGMTTLRVPGPTMADRAAAVIDRIAHPRATLALSRATRGFRAAGVERRYENALAGRRQEALETHILWHRGYRGPLVTVHDAIWRTGGPVITITFSREQAPRYLTPAEEREGLRKGVLQRR